VATVVPVVVEKARKLTPSVMRPLPSRSASVVSPFVDNGRRERLFPLEPFLRLMVASPLRAKVTRIGASHQGYGRQSNEGHGLPMSVLPRH
jgi:hypothetical protein